jgi:septal ring factor EnvC (AmiA/AmiB activator)
LISLSNAAATSASAFLRRVAFLILLLSASSFAAPTDVKREELKDLKDRIETLRRDLAKGEESRSSVADQLRDTESAVSDANRRLHELGAERAELKSQLAELEAQGQRLDRQTGAQQNQLARLLNHQFVGGDADVLKFLLAGNDPNQSARDKYFLTQLSRAKADLIQQLRTVASEKKRLADAARERQNQLAAIENRQQESRAQLLERKQQRLTTLAAIGDRLKAQRREIDTLRRDEQRMAKLIEGLARIAAAKKAAPKVVRNTPPPKVGAGETAPAPRVRNSDPGNVGGAFAALRGQLRLPVKGTLAGRFGGPRAEGGTSWKGIFILAGEGAEVKAVAGGSVVFSDWMRGFGNLLIIDHGDDFLSIYGNNESLLAAVGASVKAGEAVATVGNSGGNPDSGLYFELRHRGQPFDPLKWASSR